MSTTQSLNSGRPSEPGNAAPQSRITLGALARHAFIYGGIAGVLGGLWMIIDYSLGFQTVKPEIGRFTTYAALVIPVGALILGVMRWRDVQLGGTIRFTQAFGAALGIGLVFALIVSAIAWLHAAVIAPELVGAKIDAYANALRAAGRAPAADIDAWQAREHAQGTPALYAYQYFSGMLMQNLVIALMAAVAVRKKPIACAVPPAPKP